MDRFKEFEATGLAPNGRLYAGDLLLLQDLVAALDDFSQSINLGDISIGDSSIILSKFGAAEAGLTAALRTSGILRGLAGLLAGGFTTTARNAISSPPYGLVILNTTTSQYEWNAGSPSVPNWIAIGSDPATVILKALIDAKGDLLVGTADNTVARLPISATQGDILTVDSAQSSGMKWSSFISATRVTSLPGSPVDGQLIELVDNVNNPTYQWLLRYNVNRTGNSKWEWQGGRPMVIDTGFTNLSAHGTNVSQTVASGFVARGRWQVHGSIYINNDHSYNRTMSMVVDAASPDNGSPVSVDVSAVGSFGGSTNLDLRSDKDGFITTTAARNLVVTLSNPVQTDGGGDWYGSFAVPYIFVRPDYIG